MHAGCVACDCPLGLRWLQMRQEQSAGLFFDTLGHDKFEASSITHYKGRYVMVFDNLDEIGFVVRPASGVLSVIKLTAARVLRPVSY